MRCFVHSGAFHYFPAGSWRYAVGVALGLSLLGARDGGKAPADICPVLGVGTERTDPTAQRRNEQAKLAADCEMIAVGAVAAGERMRAAIKLARPQHQHLG